MKATRDYSCQMQNVLKADISIAEELDLKAITS
jgi:hypothetical protein